MVVTEFLRCDLCDKGFSGPEPYGQHLVSQAHLKKATESQRGRDKSAAYAPAQTTSASQQYRCDVCNVNTSGPTPYEQHVNGSKHKGRVNKQRILKETAREVPAPTADESLKCRVCEKCFSGPESYEQHLQSKKHGRKVDMEEMKHRLTGQLPATCPPAPDDVGGGGATNQVPLPETGGQLYPILPAPSDCPKIIPRAFAKDRVPKKPTGCSLFKCFVSSKKTERSKKK